METIYDINYFEKKFQSIPDEKWSIGHIEFDGKFCANGLCGVKLNMGQFVLTAESVALQRLFQPLEEVGKSEPFDGSPDYSLVAALINNGTDERYKQATPKERILAALADLRAKQHPAPKAPEVVERIVYVMVDSTVKELSGQLTNN